MKTIRTLFMAALIVAGGVTQALAECQIADAGLEEAIQQNPRFRGPANSQAVRDLRSLRDAAFTLRSYGRHEDCERLLANIRELIAGPPMGSLGDNDEEAADKQMADTQPKASPGAPSGSGDKKGANPLMKIDQLTPGLRTDEMIG